jgi:hypothetical protein
MEADGKIVVPLLQRPALPSSTMAKTNRIKQTRKQKPKKQTYTYILKDIVKGIYKIGKTTDPHSRLSNLCFRGRVVPIVLLDKDVEKDLHIEYADNRTRNDDYQGNGATEWFRPGGKFDDLILLIDRGVYLPFITANSFVFDFIATNKIWIPSQTLKWELSQNGLNFYMIGLEILVMLDFVSRENGKLKTAQPNHVRLMGAKVSITEELYNILITEYHFIVSPTIEDPLFQEHRNLSSRMRKITLDKNNPKSAIFLMLNRVL